MAFNWQRRLTLVLILLFGPNGDQGRLRRVLVLALLLFDRRARIDARCGLPGDCALEELFVALILICGGVIQILEFHHLWFLIALSPLHILD